MRIISIVRTYNLSLDCIFDRIGCFEYKKHQKPLFFSIGELHCVYSSICMEGEQSERIAIDKAIEIVKAGGVFDD